MKYDHMYMDIAKRVAQESHCPRKQVGCAIVTNEQMLATGYYLGEAVYVKQWL